MQMEESNTEGMTEAEEPPEKAVEAARQGTP